MSSAISSASCDGKSLRPTSVAATDQLIESTPGAAAAAISAIVKTQAALRADPERATEVGRKLFPSAEAALIGELIHRDLPFYDAAISPDFVTGMNQFARDVGILHGDVPYDRVVATRYAALWQG